MGLFDLFKLETFYIDLATHAIPSFYWKMFPLRTEIHTVAD